METEEVKQESASEKCSEQKIDNEEFIEANNAEDFTVSFPSDVIKPINKSTVHRICSGQVVLSLAIAVKELIENSLDAGANKIEVRLKEYGSELIEVSDNGSGVRKENFQSLTLKHFTSKIREFSDLESVETLGFRGEALSSLCALCNLSIVTKHSTADIATKVTYDHDGMILNESPTARQDGTTVTLQNLFSTLPVRRREFLKNIKRDFSKMCQLLYAYCLVCKNIKFTCTNQTSKGNINTVVATEGANTVRQNIISVFGPKQISSLVDVEFCQPDEPVLKEYSLILVPGEPLPFSFEFYVSSVTHGQGRSTIDRQFYYINSRPCEPTKISKLVNEIYRQFNSHQYPFVYLNINTQRSEIDVNVTPDKRQIFLAKEKLLLATIKSSLLEVFKSFPSTFKMQNLNLTTKFTNLLENKSLTSPRGVKRSLTETAISKKTEGSSGNIFDTFKKRPKSEETNAIPEANAEITKEEPVVKKDPNKSLKTLLKLTCMLENNEEKVSDVKKEIADETLADNVKEELMTLSNEIAEPVHTIIKLDDEKAEKTNRPSFTLNTSLQDVITAVEKVQSNKNQSDELVVKFRSKICPEANDSAEKELEKQISKTMFKDMDIIGQFNRGFVITKLGSDLFIIDQHATDEIYNFEQLQMTTVLEHQVLVNPKPLELTAANECILIENEDIFKKNGFTFKINHEAPCTKKVSLTSIPISKNCIFGKDDIDELLFMLQDSNNIMCRPSRVRAMLASRACRKSVMVGHSLSYSDMRRLIDHMGEIEQPWNCPHGRPTMRHLVNLHLIQD